ncbi:MAG: hypothetical protein H8D26_03650, partial [Methanomicrobia archaeon]|nr:hypothetical protein [Methanomicrobia archaeon]
MTKNEIYESSKTNSHGGMKEESKLRDTVLSNLLIVEAYPRGEYIDSKNEKDWELNFENKTNWFEEDKEYYKDKIYRKLFGDVIPRWKEKGITEALDLSELSYTELPDFKNIKIERLHCSHNQLKELRVPKGIKWLDC